MTERFICECGCDSWVITLVCIICNVCGRKYGVTPQMNPIDFNTRRAVYYWDNKKLGERSKTMKKDVTKQEEKKEEEKEDTTTYLVEFKGGSKKKITVPSKWRVTFGPIARNASKMPHDRTLPIALRFYEDKDRQRAIFTDVMSFRDLSIPVLEERVDTQTKFGSLKVEGANKNVSVVAETREWVDPDKETIDNTKLLNSVDVESVVNK